MNEVKTHWAEVDERGRLVLEPDVAARYGLAPGARVRLDLDNNTIRLHRPVTHLAKLYVEPTNWCNIDCVTCMRNNWEVETGFMAAETFERIIAGLKTLPAPPTVMFGGIGEPLSHAHIAEMVARVKALGCRTELITNGTLLTEKRARSLIDAGLDVLWVSIDGARPESYADVRLGAELPRVLENLRRFRRLRRPAHHPVPEIGIAFVAMERNIGDLPELLQMGKSLGVMHFHVSNLLPHTAAMSEEVLYSRTLNSITFLPSPWLRRLTLPKMDLNELTMEPFRRALDSGYNVTFAGSNLGLSNDVCTFIESGSMIVGWDGSVSPCSPLLYTHTGYLRGYERKSHRHIIGRVQERDLLDLWLDPEYVDYRERVHRFAFAPCTPCGGCEMSRENLTDCFDNPAPACGGCLWAQGVIACP
ncbi:radical SAM protein [Promineifilum sp.]|uniref:radical SAM protein n=1 Tax=Promineifilum sp. TaxID=2664178 RepID=UPI0035B41F62